MPVENLGGESLWSVDARLWGKRDKLPGPYPVVCHLIDTAAIAGALWDAWAVGLNVLSVDVLGEHVGARMRNFVCFWAGLHDIGKVSPSFQALVGDCYQTLLAEASEYGEDDAVVGLRHNEVTQWVLVEIFKALGYPAADRARRDVGHQIAQLLGGHHGQFCRAMRRQELSDPRSRPGIGEGVWEEQCRAHADVLRELTGADEALRERLPVPAAVVVLGIVIVADWLASQESFIIARMPKSGWEASPGELRAHWEVAVADAPRVVRDAGLGRGLFEDRTFKELFGFDEPNPLQASVMKELPGLVDGPGLLLATAPPGEGKTEMALYAAGVLARACRANGLGFCLPTMATTDAMHRRVSLFAKRALLGDAALAKVHSMAWLSSDAAGDAAADASIGDVVITDAEASIEATQWLRAGRRGLMAPLSTFTIDQGLTGVLPVRYNVLRLMAMAGKVVVIDEAHSYDAWMHALLLRWLEWLGAFRAPVILLSATLTGDTARSLVEAYMRGAGHGVPRELRPCYPGWLFADAVSGTVRSPREVASERERSVRFEMVPVRRGKDVARPGHRLAVVKRLLEQVVDSDRGCVLVCCTTVAEAQHTYRHIADWFRELKENGGQPPELRLLHSRYRARDRSKIIDACERDFGKTGQRPRTVLVSTQIIEQSLDLDFDLLITDLASMALLLQRSGRCQRRRDKHSDLHQARRPDWIGAEPRVVVLEPVNEEGVFAVPKEWGEVYDESLLRRTSRLLHERGTDPVEVPGDVQSLVDAVYAEDFAAVATLSDAAAREIVLADGERLAREAVQRQTASLVRIYSPHDGQLHDLHKLSESWPGVDSAWLTTRLGADSERLVCVYEQEPGVWTLDESGQVAVPGWKGRSRVTRDQARLIAEYVIPAPGRYFGEDAELLELPPAWAKNAVLRDWKLLPMRRAGERWYGRMRPGPVRYEAEPGLELVATPYALD
ncbi:CRISPR-associated endonuclease/helicase Cas3 [Sinosporangium album]|uniref:CRISPR-associated endonuclease/helicase Cas3 n=1 Tax=Sinosporangium album TaxID=504805 RepID=A0A1G7ZLJ4_9ACTN|nr:CRISPR-associated helicase Cas3' [Sinosporangium album]SDH09631.1 CRISPR-associated endonuclease/helicase Cas3 [Sinosporangium album]